MYAYGLKLLTTMNQYELADACNSFGDCPIGTPRLCPFEQECKEITPDQWAELFLGTELLPLEAPEGSPHGLPPFPEKHKD